MTSPKGMDELIWGKEFKDILDLDKKVRNDI
jgi:hypothetical protein